MSYTSSVKGFLLRKIEEYFDCIATADYEKALNIACIIALFIPDPGQEFLFSKIQETSKKLAESWKRLKNEEMEEKRRKSEFIGICRSELFSLMRNLKWGLDISGILVKEEERLAR